MAIKNDLPKKFLPRNQPVLFVQIKPFETGAIPCTDRLPDISSPGHIVSPPTSDIWRPKIHGYILYTLW
jgi:hypothetical protein